MLLQSFVKAVSFLLSFIMTVTSPFNLILGKKQEPITRAEENCKLSFASISDIHLRENFKVIFQGMLELGLEDMENAEDRLDAVAFVGDITDHGYYGMWDVFADAMSKYDIADKSFIVVGNHDTWGPNEDNYQDPENGVKSTFIKYNKSISGRDISEMYYSDIVNGYYFIVLGSEEDHTNATLSDKQLEWFSEEMEKAGKTGLPVFVFIHQPINQTHGLPYNWELDKSDPPYKGGIGDQSDRVLETIKKYDNVFVISGHIHAGQKTEDSNVGVKYSSVEYIKNDRGNNITLVNLPSYMYFDLQRGGHVPNGCGYVIEAYSDKVMIRARNFAVGTWLTKYDVTVDLV